MPKSNLQDEIRRITNENAAATAAKALEVAELAKQKAADTAALALTEALKVSTLAATKAADAASAAAQIAASTSKDLEYIKADIAATKLDIKAINEKLDNRYVSKEDFRPTKEIVDKIEEKYITKIVHTELETKEANIDAGLERRIVSIENNLSKAVWIVLGVVILAVLSLVVIKTGI